MVKPAAALPPVDMWDRRWAPAYQWEACILSKKFRQNSTDHYFQIHSKPTWYRSEAPGGQNYCAKCASGDRYNCLFYHPSLAPLFLEAIHSLDKSKNEFQLDNEQVYYYIIKKLPILLSGLGFPCEVGGVWMCIHDKLDQTFPSGNLLMVNIPYQIESRIELHSLVHDLADNTDDDSVDTIEFVGEEDSDVDDTEGKYFAEPQDCSTTSICLTHKHGSLSAGVFTEKRKVLHNDFVPDESNRKKQK